MEINPIIIVAILLGIALALLLVNYKEVRQLSEWKRQVEALRVDLDAYSKEVDKLEQRLEKASTD